MSFIGELRRRNVFRVGIAYLVAAWLLMQVADVLVPVLGLPDWTSRLVFLLLAVGFIPALIIAWAFELTPEGIRLDREVERSSSIRHVTGRKLDFAIIALLAAAVLYLVVDNYLLDEPFVDAGVDGRSIAVLPFENRSKVEEDAFFADGIQDDLLTLLSRVHSLDKVISRTSVERYRDTSLAIPEIGEELAVATILEGSVQRAGNKVRINVQLIDTRTDKHLWAEIYDRELTAENLFDIQSEIAREIVAALHGVLSEEDDQLLRMQPTMDLEAYQQYTLGRAELAKRTGDSLARAMAHFEKAVELDPDYALAWVGTADVYALQNFYGGVPFEKTIAPRQAAIDRALAIEPLSGEAYANLANLRGDEGNVEEAEKYFLRAIDLAPNYATAYAWYSGLLLNSWRPEEAVLQMRKATELDPMAPIFTSLLANTLDVLGRPEEARTVTLAGLARNPEFARFHFAMGSLATDEGNIAEAVRWYLRGSLRNPAAPTPASWVCYGQMHLGDIEEAERCFAQTEPRFSDIAAGSPHWAWMHYYRQQYDEAIAEMERVVSVDPQTGNQGFLAALLLDNNKADDAMAILAELLPELVSSGEVEADPTNLQAIVLVGRALHESGNTERANYLFDQALALMRTMHRVRGVGYDNLDVLIHVIRGEETQAIAALRDAFDEGWRLNCVFLRHPPFDTMLDNPEWVAVVEQFEADIARQRAWYEEHKNDPLPDFE